MVTPGAVSWMWIQNCVLSPNVWLQEPSFFTSVFPLCFVSFLEVFTVRLRSTMTVWLHRTVSRVNWLLYSVSVFRWWQVLVSMHRKVCHFSQLLSVVSPLDVCAAEGGRHSVNTSNRLWINIVYKGTKKKIILLLKGNLCKLCKTGLV